MYAQRRELFDAYKGNDKPVVYIDESFELKGENKFYILSSACVEPDRLSSTRSSLTDFNFQDALHASDMMRRNQLESLRLATKLVSENHDGADVVVCARIADDDKNGDLARRRCIEHIAPLLHNEFGSALYVIDHRGPANKYDLHVISDLRKSGQLSRTTRVLHTRPSVEPLLGLPDVIAWSYRQKHTKRSVEWFEPFAETTALHML